MWPGEFGRYPSDCVKSQLPVAANQVHLPGIRESGPKGLFQNGTVQWIIYALSACHFSYLLQLSIGADVGWAVPIKSEYIRGYPMNLWRLLQWCASRRAA